MVVSSFLEVFIGQQTGNQSNRKAPRIKNKQKNPLPNGKGFEAPFGENSRFTQLFKVRSCVTIKCRPPQRKRLLRANRLIA